MLVLGIFRPLMREKEARVRPHDTVTTRLRVEGTPP